MLVYTPAELKAIAGQMGKGTITDEVYLVLWNRTVTLSQAGGSTLGSIIAKYKSQGFMGYSTDTKLFD